MADETTDALETEDAEASEATESGDVGAIVDDIAAAEQTDDSDETADTDSTGEDFTPTPEQVEMAKQLKMTDEEIDNMTEAEAFAVDKVARKESRRQQLKGSTAVKADKAETSTGAESSAGGDDDDDFTEDDWYTEKGTKKLNEMLRAQKKLNARDQKNETSEKDRFQVKADEVFDKLDPEFFKDFSPGETDLIESGSDAEARRTEALVMARSIMAVGDSSGRKIPLEKALGQALSIVAETETENAALKKADAGRRTRGSQRISSPSTTKARHKARHETPEKQAVADVMEQLSLT